MKPKVILLTASLLLTSVIIVTKIVQAQNNQNNNVQTLASRKKTETELISIAEATLKVENDILVNGNIETALSRNPRALRVREALIKHFERILERRKFLTARKIGFRGFQTMLEVENI
ncbi:hypothetical protein I8751_25825 [Nostocaceae cyanobacterium CENA357]|uniref:TolC family protein n=1 Tax=Atlanticothrix silvestris CENA357 TaxID=1725252 RepID=A0A8J7HI63_9CYAN|nr:hypothetical protein [Atlanticothrix silvestris]MBH8555702.1 hypothetical protein [Atlanticothrix silvestris CENA357]